MELKSSNKIGVLWLGSLIAVSGVSAYLANPNAARTRAAAAQAAYKAALNPEPVVFVQPGEQLRDSVGAIAAVAPAAKIISTPPSARFPKPRRRLKRRAKAKKKKVRPASAANEEDFLKLYHVAKPHNLEKGKTFLVEGTAFDLESGAYVEKASLYFRDARSKKVFLVKSNDWGEYSIRLPRNIDGYRLSIYREGYRPQYLRDWSPSMKDADADIRKQVADELLNFRFEGLMVFHRAREDQLLDFALIAR